MLTKVQSALAAMLVPGEPLLAGVSGGPDSVAMLDMLISGGWHPHVCHLNHQLRGAESDADAGFVQHLAERHQLAVSVEVRDVAAFATEKKLSLEDAARQARLEFFSAVARRTGITRIALAHTADDQVETFLMRLLRGAGVPGLIGIWPERKLGPLRIIRPLLKVRRQEVLDYLAAHHLPYRTDASNDDPRFTRNRVRHELLPLLERDFNPAVREVLLRTAEILRDEDFYLLRHVAQTFYMRTSRDDALHVPKLVEFAAAVQRRLIRFWLGGEDESGQRFSFDHIESVRAIASSASPSAEVDLPGDVVVYREYEWLRKGSRKELAPVEGKWPLKMEGETVLGELGVSLHSHLEPCEGNVLRFAGNDKNAGTEWLDADALGEEPIVRTWQEGDRFQPLGMSETKKLQDFFVDEKVPRRERGRLPLLCAADGRIAWVVGVRMGDAFKVTESTRRVLRVRFKG
jgi:tRNA(Ile)-lysidine synthase